MQETLLTAILAIEKILKIASFYLETKMQLARRSFLAAPLVWAAVPGHSATPSWPTRPVKIVVPFPPGGPTDFVVRLMTAPLAERLGQPVIIDNRPGVSGNLGAQQVAEAEPDGHTLVHNTVGVQAVNPLMYPNPRFIAQRDLIGVATTATMPNVLVINPKVTPARTLKELVDLGHKAPNTLSIANFGSGTSAHIYAVLLQKVGGFLATDVPYRGSPLALNDVISGQVNCVFDSISTCVGHVRSGALHALAVTSQSRTRMLPDVPTMAEAGFPAFDLKFWFALFASAKTPPALLAAMRSAIGEVLAVPSYQSALRQRGAEPLLIPQADLARFLTAESQRWTDIAKQIGVKAQT